MFRSRMSSSSLPASAVIIVLSWQLIHGASYVLGKTNQVEDENSATTETPIDEKSDIDSGVSSTEASKYLHKNHSQETTDCPEEISNQNEADWEDPCTLSGDGFYPNYTSNCQQYYRCENHLLVSTHSCRLYSAFSTNLQDCVSSTEVTCVEPQCPAESPGTEVTFITPGTQCRVYHICGPHGQRGDHLCPQGHVYDRNSKKCVSTPWMCREPICTGRVDGNYADSSEDCRRSFCCRGGHLTSVAPCPQGQLYGPPCLPAHLVACPPPSSSAAPILIGGTRPAKPSVPTISGPCSLLQDGLYRNFTGDACRDYFRCSNKKVISTYSCPPRTSLILLPAGNPSAAACLSSSLLVCLPLRPEGRPPCGPVPSSNCGRHVECEARGGGQGKAVLLACPEGRAFDGQRCVLPSDAPPCKEGVHQQITNSPCAGQPDGYHEDPGSPSCRGYVYCGGGHSISYICPRGFAFNGEQCAPAEEVHCPQAVSFAENKACTGMWAGYVADTTSGCQSYFYCQAGDHITTLTCPRGHIFDSRRCVPGVDCVPDSGGCSNLPDGHYPDLDSVCKDYFRCAAGFRVENLSCPEGRGFDGRACIDAGLLNCSPQSFAATTILIGSSSCQTGNGFFQDIDSGCHRYYYCIDGERTWLSCQGNEVFDGQVCVPAGTYTCPTSLSSPCNSSNCNKFLRVRRVFAAVLGKGVFVNSLQQTNVQKTSTTKAH